MSCNHPLHAFVTGSKTDLGKPDYFVQSGEGDIVEVSKAEKAGHHVVPGPHVRGYDGKAYLVEYVPIPCGHCIGCRMDRAKDWRVRVALEKRYSEFRFSWFITLTYDDEHCPKNLVKKDIQDFIRSFRRNIGPCRYFGSGEYGEIGLRPHFHLILFTDFDSDFTVFGRNHFRSAAIEKCWENKGFVDICSADAGLIAYCAGYVEKKQDDRNFYKYQVKPFLVMSRRPGIGSKALEHLDAVLSTYKVYGDFGKCHYSRIPRSMLKKLEVLFPEWMEAYRETKIKYSEDKQLVDIVNYQVFDREVLGSMKDKIQKDSLKEKRRLKL